MRTLTDSEKVCILATAHCPHCREFLDLRSEQTDTNVQTTSAFCPGCRCTYSIDRVNEAPFEILGGHQYGGE